MKKVQAIIIYNGRIWDAIRDTEKQALMRIAEHLKKDYDQKISAIGDSLKMKLIFNNPAVEMLESHGFIVEINELNQGDQSEKAI